MTPDGRQGARQTCGEPQPSSSNRCRLFQGHGGFHRAPVIGGWVWQWTQDFAWASGVSVTLRPKIGRRNYLRPSEIRHPKQVPA